MKTAEQKADEFMRILGDSRRVIRENIILLVEKQDLDTRHACTEAICALDAHDAPCGDLGILLRDAHIACLNAKAC